MAENGSFEGEGTLSDKKEELIARVTGGHMQSMIE